MRVPGAHLTSLGYYEVRPSDVTGRDILVLDVRPLLSFREERIEAAQHFDVRRDFDVLSNMLPFDFGMVVVCERGAESKSVCKRLVSMGYSEVHHLVGGLRRWRAEQHPVHSGADCQSFCDPLPASVARVGKLS